MKLFKHHSYVLHEDMLPSHLIILEEKKLFTFFSLSIQVYPRSFLWKCWSNKPVPATEKMCATWKAKKEPFPPSSPNLIWVIISESSNQLMWCAYYLSKTFCWLIKKVQELLERTIPYPIGVYAFLFIFRKESKTVLSERGTYSMSTIVAIVVLLKQKMNRRRLSQKLGNNYESLKNPYFTKWQWSASSIKPA